MISKQEAIEIAHTYISGEIFKESCRSYPNFYHIVLMYRDQDGNIFKDAISINNRNGVIVDWGRQLVDEERVMD